MGLLSDERLAQRAARGERRAFESIYKRYHQQLYRFCLAMIGNPADAQDALQNTMVKVLRALPGEKRRIELKPWLYRIARNESVEVLRRRRDSEELAPDRAGGAEVAATAEARERLRSLLADLDQLTERQRAALVMRELAGLSFAQIAATFDTSVAVARQTLYEARLSLRQLEAGRSMHCADVMRELSDGDRRVLRRREIRAHLRGCAGCRSFEDGIGRRRDELGAIAPLPLAASAGVLHGALGSQAGAGGASGLAGGIATGAGTSAIVKSAVTVAVVAVAGVSAGERSGLTDLPLPGKDGGAPAQHAPPSPPASRGDEDTSTGQQTDGPGLGRHPSASGGQVGADVVSSSQNEDGDDGIGDPGTHEPVASGADPVAANPGSQPPGEGQGNSAAAGQGRPEELPEAASHGQQEAATHKPAHAADPLGGGAPPSGHGKPAEPGAPASKPASPPAPPPVPSGHPSPPASPGPPSEPPGKGSPQPHGPP